MIPVTTMAGRTVAVFGLGRSGRSTCLALRAGGASTAAWDDNAAARSAAEAAGIDLVDLASADWKDFAALVLAPGIPLTHPAPHWTVERAKAAAVPVIGDVELFARERAAHAPAAPFIAITGTNGKSTTTALMAHVLRSAGRDAQMGGNIGVPILELEPPTPDRTYVVELSSYQIDLTPSLAPDVGLLLNITPDHIDRHGTFANYAAVKERLVASARLVVLGVDDGMTREGDPCMAVASRLEAAGKPVALFTRRRSSVTHAVYFEDGKLQRQISLGDCWCLGEILTDLSQAQGLHGAHNGENAAAVFLACEWLELPHDEIAAGLKSFPGLAHRMEPVATLAKPDGGEILFINDSKATNADSADKALAAFERDIYWIAGGRAKEGGIASLRARFPRLAAAYLVGEAAEELAGTIGSACPVAMSGTIEAAVAAAAEAALRSDAASPVVLLSPACASWDQFTGFEARGDAFREAVAKLPGIELIGKASS
jgi:UDP-N-acetylmuramoylalanine--D-glutamate ligase